MEGTRVYAELVGALPTAQATSAEFERVAEQHSSRLCELWVLCLDHGQSLFVFPYAVLCFINLILLGHASPPNSDTRLTRSWSIVGGQSRYPSRRANREFCPKCMLVTREQVRVQWQSG